MVIGGGDTQSTPDQGPTYGSLSIQNGGVQIRLAAATSTPPALIDLAERNWAPSRRGDLEAANDGVDVARISGGGRSSAMAI